MPTMLKMHRSAMKNKTIKLVYDGPDHSGAECDECWSDWPRLCVCGGNVHAEFFDEMVTTDGPDYCLVYGCDNCDEWEEE